MPADGAFAMWSQRRWDAVLAMYHDQGLAPFKALSFGGGVNVTLGLPVIRTSPDHGTAYEIAGQGVAPEEQELLSAVKGIDAVLFPIPERDPEELETVTTKPRKES